MFSPVTKATFRTLLCVAAFASFAVPSGAQVVEKGRTLDDLIASHPCASGLENRIARVTDCDAADDFGDGGGAFQCWAYCDGSAPWTNLAIGGGGGGGIDGTLAATDNLIVRTDGTGGSTIQASPLSLSDVSGVTTTLATITPAATTGATVAGQALAITASPAVASTDTAGAAEGGSVTITAGAAARLTSGNANGGNINLVTGSGIGTGRAGQVLTSYGSAAAPAYSFSSAPTSGIYGTGSSVEVSVAGTQRALFNANGLAVVGRVFGDGGTNSYFSGFRLWVAASASGSGSPNSVNSGFGLSVNTNEGTTAENYNTLPSAVAGFAFTFVVQDADGLRITAAAGDTIRPGAVAASAAAGYIRCATQGASITLVAINATEWVAVGGISGTWTVDS